MLVNGGVNGHALCLFGRLINGSIMGMKKRVNSNN